MFKNGQFPFWHGRALLLLFQTLCLLRPRCLRCCLQRNYFPPSDVSGRQSLALRSWPSCVLPFVHGEVVVPPTRWGRSRAKHPGISRVMYFYVVRCIISSRRGRCWLQKKTSQVKLEVSKRQSTHHWMVTVGLHLVYLLSLSNNWYGGITVEHAQIILKPFKESLGDDTKT